MSITIHDLARNTGFNASTVSRALRGDGRISQQTVNKIMDAAAALGYVRNFAASNLAAGKNKCVALIMDAVAGTMQTLPAAALNQVLINAGYTLMILLHNNEKKAMENCISKLEQRICDAAVMIPPPESILDQQLIDRIARLPIPLCFIDRWLENVDAAVATTHVEKSIRLLLKNVLSENLDGAFILPPQGNTVARARFFWETKILDEKGIPWSSDLGKLQDFIIDHRIETLGVFADGPWITCNIRSCLPRQVPHRFIGGMFDHWANLPPDFYDRIYLCLQNFTEIGKKSAQMVLEILDGKKLDEKVIEVPPEGVTVINCQR